MGDPLFGGGVEVKLSLFDQLHGARAGDRLGHRSDPADRIRRHRLAGRQVALPKRPFVQHPFAVHDDRHNSRHIATLDGCAQETVYTFLQHHC